MLDASDVEAASHVRELKKDGLGLVPSVMRIAESVDGRGVNRLSDLLAALGREVIPPMLRELQTEESDRRVSVAMSTLVKCGTMAIVPLLNWIAIDRGERGEHVLLTIAEHEGITAAGTRTGLLEHVILSVYLGNRSQDARSTLEGARPVADFDVRAAIDKVLRLW